MRTVHFAAVLSLLLAAQATGARAEETQPALSSVQLATYADAVRSFREQRFSAAYGRFARLADAGHAPSAQLALLMYKNGQTLFGANWSASPDQQRRWIALGADALRGRYVCEDNDRGD